MKMLWKSGAATIFALLLAGCSTVEYYQDRAVNRAREFLAENAPELTASELYYAKYHKPILLVSDVVGDVAVGGTNVERKAMLITEQKQICVTWKFPDRKEYYMVYGVSSRTMEWWYPSRLIRKNFVKQESSAFRSAVESARRYAQDNLWEIMTPKVLNQIRFRDPWVLKTSFDLNFNPDGKLSPEELEKARKKAAGKTQISLVWKPEAGDWVVFSGVGDEKMVGWSILMAGFLSPDDVKKHTVDTLAIPGEDGKAHRVSINLQENVSKGVPQTASKDAAAPAQKAAAVPKTVPAKNGSASEKTAASKDAGAPKTAPAK